MADLAFTGLKLSTSSDCSKSVSAIAITWPVNVSKIAEANLFLVVDQTLDQYFEGVNAFVEVPLPVKDILLSLKSVRPNL